MSPGGLRVLGERVFTWAVSKRARILSLVVIVAIGTFGVMHGISAEGPWETAKNSLFGMLGEFLGFIIDFMGRLVILLTNILIEFASYNNFVNSGPVTIGWVLVRDVVNMFFIVILLVSAFSTIIGYSEFHYSKVLPKLLLMAVLINFSKTLIGLLIDFSQVLMLTFVNAFKPAAGGNFISLLKLNQVTQLDDKLVGLDSTKFGELIIATMLGIMMLGITLTILVIMVAFMIYRIIALWMLLILSPMAFFALALPGKLAKGMSAFTSKFWDRLSNLLIAGPVMAFFLWLALAIAQGNQGFSDLYTRQTSEVEDATGRFVSGVGNAQSIATFIVAIAFLLSGLEFAVSTANALSPTLGKFAAGVSAGGGALPQAARLAARLTGRGARIAGKGARVAGAVTGAVAGTGFNAIDRYADLRGKIGQLGAQIVPLGIGRKAFTDMQKYRGKRIQETQKEQAEQLKGLNSATQLQLMEKDSKSSNPYKAEAAKLGLATHAMTSIGIKARAKGIEDELKKTRPNLTDAERRATAQAQAYDKASQAVQAGMKIAEEQGDDEKIEKYKKAIKENPNLNASWAGFSYIKGDSVENPEKYAEKISAEAVKDSRAALAHMYAMGLVNAQGQFVNDPSDEDNQKAWKKLQKGDRGSFIKAHVAEFQNRPEDVRAMLLAMDGSEDADVLKRANEAHHFVSKDDKGNIGSVFVTQNLISTGGQGRQSAPQNAAQLVSTLDAPTREKLTSSLAGAGISGQALDDFAKRFSGPVTVDQAQYLSQNARSYTNTPVAGDLAGLPRMVELTDGLARGIQPPPAARNQVYGRAMEAAGASGLGTADRLKAAGMVANFDVAGLKANDEIKETIVNAVHGQVAGLADALKASKNDPATMKKMEALIKELSTQANQAKTKALAGTKLTEIETKLAEIGEEIGKQSVLSKASGRKEKKERGEQGGGENA